MRILGYIDHPQLKITVFKMDNRISIKFENARYEQTYKFDLDERIDGLDAVRHFVDADFLTSVQIQMQQMHRTQLDAFARHFPAPEGETFEDII